MDEPTGRDCDWVGWVGNPEQRLRVAMNENEMPKAQRKMRSMGG